MDEIKLNSLDSGKADKAVNLDAKLHLGHDPSTEFKHSGNLFSSVTISDDKNTGAQDDVKDTVKPEGLFARISESISTFFNPDWHRIEQAREKALAGLASENDNFSAVHVIATDKDSDSLSSQNRENFQNDLLNDPLADNQSRDASQPVPEGQPRGYVQPSGGGGEESQSDGSGNSERRSSTGNDDQLGSLNAATVTAHFAQGMEGQPFTAVITVNTDQSANSTWITISGLPQGAILSAGTRNNDGSWTLAPNQLPGLTITSPDHDIGIFNIHIEVTSTRGGDSVTTGLDSTIDIWSVAAAPSLQVQSITGNEDSSIALNISAALVNPDPSENLTIVIGGLPPGSTLSAGTQNGNGTWTLNPADLTGLTLTPPLHYSGNINLTVTATASENGTTASTTASFTVDIHGIATTPLISVQSATGFEDTAIALNITAALQDNDGSETLAIVITNVPAGAILSAGINHGNGIWILTPSELNGLTLTPSADFHGSLSLNITAVSMENGTAAIASTTLGVTVAGTADPATLTVQPSSGNEDTAIALNITASASDPGETLSLIIGNIPAGAHLSNGTDNGNGTWTLTPAQLTGLTFTPPQHQAGSYTLSVTAITTENGTTASTSASLALTVAGVATAPTLSVSAANGIEDSSIPLLITAGLADNDGSETLSITIGNLPPGAHLSAGTDNGNGTWTLTPAQLAGLTFTPPAHASGDYDLSVTAISNENGSTSSVNTDLHISVAGTASTPALSVQAAIGTEDSPIALNINATLTDNDGSETLTITIGNLPAGAILSAGSQNPDGTWTLTPADLSNLTLTPPLHFSGSLNLSITATSSENGTTADKILSLPVTVEGIAIAPILSTTATSAAEDTPVPLSIGAALAVNDNATLSITISNLPTGAVLSAGTHNPDGSWTLTPAQLTGLTLIPPQNYSGTINLSVTATSSENGTTASTTSNLSIAMTGVADAPTLSVHAITASEDTAIALNINAGLTDNDGSETLTVTITGIPANAILSAGTANPDGSWTLTAGQLNGLTLTPAPNYSGTLNLNVTATSSEDGTTASTSLALPVTINGTADAPTLNVQAATGNEDTVVALNINAALTDTDGSETLSITIAGLPAGSTLSAGTNNGNGTWTLTQAQLTGLTLTPGADWNGSANLTVTATSSENGTTASTTTTLPLTINGVADAPTLSVQAATGNEDTAVALNISAALTHPGAGETLTVTLAGLPAGAILSAGTHNQDGSWTLTPAQLTGLTLSAAANWSGTANLTVTATSSDNGTTATTTTTLPLTVHGIADAPTLSVQAATGLEDAAIALHINAALTDNDGSETLNVTIGGVPAGAVLSAGIHNPDGTWTLTGAQLTNLTLTPAANFTGAINLLVTASASEDGTTANSTVASLPVTVHGVADTPTLSVQAAAGNEDTVISLHINAALTDTSGGETLSVTIAGVPNGATLSAGTHNPDGTWTLSPAQLSNLTLTPPTHWAGQIDLSVTATSSQDGTTASAVALMPVVIAGVATTPLLNVGNVFGAENVALLLPITAALADTDGSETLIVTINGLPAGAVLSAGTHNPDGSWTLTPNQLNNLVLVPGLNWHGTTALTITATSSENGTTASTSASLPVNVSAVAHTPSLSVQGSTGAEDTPIALHINSSLSGLNLLETMSVTIGNVPGNATLSAGINNGDGTWTLTQAQLTGLTLTTAHDFSGNINLSVTSTSTLLGTDSSVSTSLPITVTGVADAPTLSVQAASGTEDSPVALNIASALTDTDGSETLTITISGLPAGASLSAGVHNPDGSYTLTPAQLTGLTLTAAANWSGSTNLTVTATSSEAGTTATTTSTLALNIAGVADAPTLSVQNAVGNEDTAIALHINAGLSDTDGSETLAITISGLPAGASLSAGTNNGNGTWTLSAAQLTNLSLVPAANWSGTASLSITATSSENGTTASTSTTLPLTINGVADAPTLSVQAASGSEDLAIALNITSALTDTDGSETLAITIGNLPPGATLSAGINNGNGTWTLNPAQLGGLTLNPAANWSGTASLSVTATSSENGTTATTTTTLPLTVTGIADTPTLSVQAASGNEDTAIALHINAGLSDTDGSETLTITVTGVPTGAILSAGTHNPDGTWTLNGAQLSNLTITPAANFSGTINLGVTATSSEAGTTASTSLSLPVTVAGVPDAPALTVQSSAGNEDSAIALHINAALTDTDGSETLSIVIGNLPAGSTLSAGTNNGDGTWTLTQAQLSGLTLTPSANWSGTGTLSVTAISGENGTTASTTASLALTVSGVADAPTLSIQTASGNEDTAIALNINAALTDTSGAETLSITIAGLPAGATLSAGIHNSDGTYTLTPAQLSGLTLTPAANWSGTANLTVTATSSENGSTANTSTTLPLNVSGVADAPTLSVQTSAGNEDTAIALHINAGLTDIDGSETLSITIGSLPPGATLSAGTNNGNGTWTLTAAQLTNLNLIPAANWSGSASLSVTATSSENGTTATTATTLPLTINGVADAPTLSIQAATGNEDTAIALNINAARTDTDGSETLSITITGVPTGAILSAGTNNGNGNWTLTPAQLTGLTLTPAANWSGTASLSVTATTSENGTTATTSTTLPLTVSGVADAPTLSVQSASGNEDTVIALNIISALTDTDGSETLSITIGSLPTGAILSAGVNNGNGTWTLTPAQLTGLTLTPAANWSGTTNLTVTATSSENGTTALTAGTLALTVNGVADTPTLSVQSSTGNEDTAIVLHINAALTDTDGSETLSIKIAGIPSGATLSAGTHNADGTWTLTSAQLTNLTLTPAANYSGDLNLTVTATSSENGTTAATVTTLPLHVLGVADIPTLSVQSASGNEDSAIALNIRSALTDTDGSEQLSIAVGGVPAGASLSAGINNGNGTWTLTSAQLTGLTLTPPANWSGTFTLSVSAASAEDGTWATATMPLHVNVVSVADTPTLSVAAATGAEDTAIALTIQPGLTDSSENLSIMISGVPVGASLSAGLYAGNGHWSLNSADLNGLTITPPANYSGTMALTATAVSTASNGASATLSLPINVTVTPVADTPTLILAAVTGKEDNAISLGINSVLRDTDGSENLTVQITGVPTGATLSAGTNAGGGVWNLTGAQLANLKITPPANSDADFTLNVTATSHESNGATSSVSGTIPVTVLAVADTPTVSAGNVVGTANSQIALTIAGALTDSSENLTFVIHGMPDGFSLNQGTNNGDNSWSLTQANLSGLKLISPPNFNGQLTLYAQSVSHDNDGSTAVSTATPFTARVGNYGSGYLVDLGVNLHLGGIGVGVQVGAVPVDLFQTVGSLLSSDTNIYTKEDTATQITSNNFNILALPLLDGVTTLIAHIEFQNVPTGVTFSAGTNFGSGVWRFTTANMQGLTMYTPANSDTDFSITVVSKMLLGLLPITLGTANIHVQGIADMPTLSASVGATTEGSAVALNIAGASTDSDGSEAISFLVAGMPAGFTLNHGIDNGNGTWSLQSADLPGLIVIPTNDYSGAVNLVISSITTEKSTATDNEGDSAVNQTTLTLNITPVADAPAVVPVAATGNEDQPLTLNLGIALKDTDGSEQISSVTISGLPTGAILTGATDNHNGTWSADVSHLDQVQLVPGANWHGDATLTVTAVSRESANGSTATTTSTLAVHINAVADAPVATATDSTGTIGSTIGLHVAAATTDSSEHLSAVISGIPHDAMLSAGTNNGDGTWTLSSTQLNNLQITPADNFTGDLNLSLTAYSREDNGSLASTSQNFSVHVTAGSGGQVGGGTGQSWLDATDTASGGTPADPVHTASQDAQAAIDAASHAAHAAGSDYQNAFQSHQTG